MKTLITTILFTLIYIVACQAQPKSDYEIYSDPVVDAVKYHFFLEKESGNPYQLVQGMDYQSVLALKVGEADIPVFTVNLDNDGSEYALGVVAENSEGVYSGMGVGLGNTGTTPSVPGGVGLRKK